MLTLPPSVRLFVCTQPTDMRRSFDGLAMMVETILKRDPFSGHLFVFRNRRHDRIKVLYWDRDGYALWYKRLEKGVFQFSTNLEDGAELRAGDLAMLLDGIDPTTVKRSRRYARRASTCVFCSPSGGDSRFVLDNASAKCHNTDTHGRDVFSPIKLPCDDVHHGTSRRRFRNCDPRRRVVGWLRARRWSGLWSNG